GKRRSECFQASIVSGFHGFDLPEHCDHELVRTSSGAHPVHALAHATASAVDAAFADRGRVGIRGCGWPSIAASQRRKVNREHRIDRPGGTPTPTDRVADWPEARQPADYSAQPAMTAAPREITTSRPSRR